jgi:hypothetical protein
MPLYLKDGKLLQTGGTLAASADCCCETVDTTTYGCGSPNCSGGVSPTSLLATVALTIGADNCSTVCTSELVGSHVLTTQTAVPYTASGIAEFPVCGGFVERPTQCYFSWFKNHDFAPVGLCEISGYAITVLLYKDDDGHYRLYGLINAGWVPGGARVSVEFVSDSLGTTAPDCVADLDGVVLHWNCSPLTTRCPVTGGSITLAVI